MNTFTVMCVGLLGIAGLASFSSEALSANTVFSAVAAPALQPGDTTKVQVSTLKKAKKERKPAAAKVSMKREITRATLSQQSDEGTSVEVLVMSQGMKVRNIEDLQMIGSSGTPVITTNYTGYDYVSFPFEGNVRFKAPNKLGTMVYDREVRFTVTEPGRWVIKLDL
ncbi:hypothetical protein ACXYMU_13530 [Pontibacter sp. CAU 1760]